MAVYESPKARFSFGEGISDDDDDDNVFVKEVARTFGRENVGPVASSNNLPKLYNGLYLDTQYGISKDGDSFKIGDSSARRYR